MNIAIVLPLLLVFVEGKIFKNCELAHQLVKYGLPRDQIATWVCIAFRESTYNTEAISYSHCYGLFQICREWWCSPPGKGCGVKCTQLLDDDIEDDVKCVKTVFEQTRRLTGDGFTAWEVYPMCKNASSSLSYIKDCNF